MRNISPDEVAITRRFFTAVDTLKANRVIHGLTDFIERHGLNQSNISVLKNNPEIRGIKSVYLKYLCEDYGVSAYWLLTGKGDMFTRTFSRNGESLNRENEGEERKTASR